MLVWNFGHTPNFSLFIPSAKNIFDWGTKIKICLMNVVVHICTLKDNLQYFPFNSFKQWWYHSILYRYMKRVRVRSHIHKFFSPEDLSTAHEGNIRENEQLLSLSPSTPPVRGWDIWFPEFAAIRKPWRACTAGSDCLFISSLRACPLSFVR